LPKETRIVSVFRLARVDVDVALRQIAGIPFRDLLRNLVARDSTDFLIRLASAGWAASVEVDCHGISPPHIDTSGNSLRNSL
jgi:hypothetical protein